MSLFKASLLFVLLSLIPISKGLALSGRTTSIRFVDRTYRRYVGKQDKQHPWHNGADTLIKRGFDMVPVGGTPSDEPVSSIDTPLGPVGLSAATPFLLQDFAAAYNMSTPWPYCQSLSECLVFSQNGSPASKAPISIQLPPGVAALDLYIDAAIDCVTVTKAVVSCKVKAISTAGSSVAVKVSVSSICDSPFVGRYVGFFDASEDLQAVSIACKSSFPTALGLMRIGTRR